MSFTPLSQRWLLLGLAVLIGGAHLPLACLAFPGILLLFVPLGQRIRLSDLAVLIPGASLAFWAVSFWFLAVIPIAWSTFSLCVMCASLLLAVLLLIRRSAPYPVATGFEDVVVIGVLLLVLILRLLPLGSLPVPAGADMSMHTYIAHLILQADGIPASYRPILGIDEFGTFPVAFHCLTALHGALSGAAIETSAFILTGFTHFLVTAALFLLFKVWVRWPYALFSALLVTFFTVVPQWFVHWGGNPTVLGMAFLALFLAQFERRRDDADLGRLLLAGFALAALVLTHTLVLVQSFYMLAVPFLALVVWRRDLVILRRSAGIILLTAILTAPYILTLDLGAITPATKDWIRHWVRDPHQAWHGDLSAPWTIFSYVDREVLGHSRLRFAFAIALVGFVLLWKDRRRTAFFYTTFAVVGLILIANTRYWVLPLSWAIYPERTAALLVIPLGLFLAYTLEGLTRILESRPIPPRVLRLTQAAVLIGGIALAVSYNTRLYVNPMPKFCRVTPADMKAFEWIRENTASTDVFLNNYGDGGLWIPAVALRPVTNAHVNVLYTDRVPPPDEPRWVYIGNKPVERCDLTAGQFLKSPDHETVFHHQGVWIFRVR